MTNKEALQWLFENNATLKLVTIGGYTFFQVTVKDRVFHVSIFGDSAIFFWTCCIFFQELTNG